MKADLVPQPIGFLVCARNSAELLRPFIIKLKILAMDFFDFAAIDQRYVHNKIAEEMIAVVHVHVNRTAHRGGNAGESLQAGNAVLQKSFDQRIDLRAAVHLHKYWRIAGFGVFQIVGLIVLISHRRQPRLRTVQFAIENLLITDY